MCFFSLGVTSAVKFKPSSRGCYLRFDLVNDLWLVQYLHVRNKQRPMVRQSASGEQSRSKIPCMG